MSRVVGRWGFQVNKFEQVRGGEAGGHRSGSDPIEIPHGRIDRQTLLKTVCGRYKPASFTRLSSTRISFIESTLRWGIIPSTPLISTTHIIRTWNSHQQVSIRIKDKSFRVMIFLRLFMRRMFHNSAIDHGKVSKYKSFKLNEIKIAAVFLPFFLYILKSFRFCLRFFKSW